MSQFETFWDEMPARRKTGLVVGVVVILAVSVGLWFWASQSKMVPLYSDITDAEVSAITQALSAGKIEYRIGPAGDAVLVDEKQMSKAQMWLAQSGHVDGQMGFELFDNVDYGMSEFSQKIYLQRALQGEIARTITALDEIKYARVHLVLPEVSLFAKEAQDPKAAVTIVPAKGKWLSSDQVKGIQNLVASAVRGLSPDRVLITDQQGNPLSRGGESLLSNSKLEQKREVERYLGLKAQEILEQIYGPGVALLKVNVALNHERVERQTERLLPANDKGEGVIVEKRETSKHSEADQYSSDKSKSPSGRVTTTSEIKYAMGRSVEQYVLESGGIKRLSVSVLVPGPIDAEAVTGLKQLIANAIGLDTARGDTIEVHGMKMAAHRVDTESALSSVATPISSVEIGRNGFSLAFEEQAFSSVALLIIGVLILLVILLILWLRPRSAPKRLSSEERERLLLEVRGWLDEDVLPSELKS